MSDSFKLPLWMPASRSSSSTPEWLNRFVQQFGSEPDTPAAHAFLRTTAAMKAFGLEWPWPASQRTDKE
jgi:hypothetical protein